MINFISFNAVRKEGYIKVIPEISTIQVFPFVYFFSHLWYFLPSLQKETPKHVQSNPHHRWNLMQMLVFSRPWRQTVIIKTLHIMTLQEQNVKISLFFSFTKELSVYFLVSKWVSTSVMWYLSFLRCCISQRRYKNELGQPLNSANKGCFCSFFFFQSWS